jgi:hypothetical protein
MPNRGLLLGIRHPACSAGAAGRKGDPQWHAGDDPPLEEACELTWRLHQSEQRGYGAVKTCNAVLKHGEALCAV